MKKKGYYEYDQPIYPHLLGVGVGLQFEDRRKKVRSCSVWE